MSVAMMEPFPVFAARHVRERVVGFQKDIDICLTPTRHPAKKKPTAAFSPALGTCCSTLEYLTSLYTGRKDPTPPVIARYARKYLPKLYDEATLEVLYSAFRHAIAHRGIVSGVWIDERTGNRIAWHLSDAKSGPAILLVEKAGDANNAPWRCPYSHRVNIRIRRLADDIASSALRYAADIAAGSLTLDGFRNRMVDIFPPAGRRLHHKPAGGA